MTVKERAKKIKLLVLDVDGVLTDGRIIYDDKGAELKCFNVKDGLGLSIASEKGLHAVIITAKGSKAVLRRARDMGVKEVFQNAHDKYEVYKGLIKRWHLKDEEVGYVGDDLIDLPILERVGLSACPSDANSEIKNRAHFVAKNRGGKGAVREVVELILKSQKKWNGIVKKYLALILAFIVLSSAMGCAKKELPPPPSSAERSGASPKGTKVESEDVGEKIATFHLAGFTTGGQKKWSIDGKSADIVSELVYLTEISAYFYGGNSTVHLTADRGTFNKTTGNIHLESNVVATATNGAKLMTSALDWDAKQESMTTKAVVSVERDKLFAIGLGGVAKPSLSKAIFLKNVRVNVNPVRSQVTTQDTESASNGVKPKATIICEGPLEVDYRKSIATFKNNVKALDDRGEVYGDIVKVRFDSKGEGIISAHAWGNVRIVRGTDISYSEEAIYETKIGRLLLMGRPKLVLYRKE